MNIEQLQAFVDTDPDLRQLGNVIVDYLQANPGGGGSSSYLVYTALLTDAQIKALPTTPIELVAAPGAGKLLSVLQAVYHFNIVTGYTLSDASEITAASDLLISWGTNQANATKAIPSSEVLVDPQTNLYFIGGTPSVSGLTLYANVPASQAENRSLCMASDSENSLNYIGGNAANTLRVTVAYMVVDL